MKTIFVNPKDFTHNWYIVDAKGKTLGRVAAKVASVLRGKNKPYYTPHQHTGDHVVIINAADIAVTGKKMTDKMYHRHSGFPGGITSIALQDMLKRNPRIPLEAAIKGMLPKNRLGRRVFTHVKVYGGSEHPHSAQKPVQLEV